MWLGRLGDIRDVKGSKPKLDVRAWNALQAALKGLDKQVVKVGILASKGGGKADENGFTLADRAAVHEYGSEDGTIPERRWLRGTFATYEKELIALQTSLAKSFFRGHLTADKALQQLGVWSANKVKTHVKQDTITPPLKLSTIAAKGSDRPLIDTGLMVNSVNYEVVKDV